MMKSPLGSLLLLALATTVVTAQETPPPAAPPAEETPAPATPAPEAPPAETPAPAANHAADLTAAAEKLSAATSYGWSQTSSFGGNFGDRTTTGKKGSGGFLLITMPGRDQEIQVLSRKGKAALQRDGAWVVPDPEAEGQGQGPGRWTARMVQNLREPAVELKELVAKVADVKNESGSFRATLPEAAAKELMSFRGFGRRGGGGGGGGGTPPEVTGAAGSVTFTVADGVLTGYEMTLTGRMNFNGQDRDLTRTTKVTFSGVDSTTFDIPESAAGLFAE